MKGPAKLILFVGAISLAYTQANQKVAEPVYIQPDAMMSESADNTTVKVDTMSEKIEDIKYDRYNVVSNLIEFSTINPVNVYFAILLIIVATLLQGLNVFVFKKDIAWIVFLLIVGGFAAVLISSRNFQPQTEGLVRRAALIMEMHQNWAQWTIRTGFLAIILQIIHLHITKFDKVIITTHRNTAAFPSRKNRMLMTLIVMIMLSSAFCVVRAGHLGAQLVHIEGVGPLGIIP